MCVSVCVCVCQLPIANCPTSGVISTPSFLAIGSSLCVCVCLCVYARAPENKLLVTRGSSAIFHLNW
jgi:hypothetical protein